MQNYLRNDLQKFIDFFKKIFKFNIKCRKLTLEFPFVMYEDDIRFRTDVMRKNLHCIVWFLVWFGSRFRNERKKLELRLKQGFFPDSDLL